MSVLESLRAAGVAARDRRPPRAEVDALITVSANGDFDFAVEQRQRAPYPNELSELERVRASLAPYGQPLLMVPFVSESMAAHLTDAGWSWADAQGNFDLRGPGLLLRQRRTTSPPKPAKRSLPQGSGSLAIIRALIRFEPGEAEEQSATALARQAKVSQPRASQVVTQLSDLGLVERSHGRLVPHREALLDRFLAEYRGPGGSERHFYSLDSPTEVALRAARAASRARPVAVSADVGPDLLAPWRRPTTVVLYADHDLDVRPLGLVEAQSRHDANVIVRMPVDHSVFREHVLAVDVQGVDVPLADETQLIWDLHDLGGTDRLEAAGRLREWLLRGR